MQMRVSWLESPVKSMVAATLGSALLMSALSVSSETAGQVAATAAEGATEKKIRQNRCRLPV